MSNRTPAQNRALWGLVGRLATVMGVERAEAEQLVRDWCEARFSTRSTSGLDQRQMGQLIEQVEAAARGAATVATTPAPATTPTPHQQDVLAALWDQAGYTAPAARSGFCRRQTGYPWPQNQGHVTALMRALTAIVQRGADVAEVRAQIVRLAELPNLTPWERDVFLPDITRQARDLNWRPRPHQLAKLDEIEHCRAQGAA